MTPALKIVFDVLKARGLTVALVNGRPVLQGPAEQKTDKLLRALKGVRAEIIAHLEREERRNRKPEPSLF